MNPRPADGKCGAFLPMGTWLALALYAAIVIPYFSYVPIWDAMDYLEAYLFWPRDHLDLEAFFYSENGHPSFGYYWPFWIGQTFFPDSLLVVQMINLAIGALAIVAFGGLAARAFAERAGRLELGLLTMAFAISPVFVAYAVNPTMDSGVVAYFLATLWLLYANRPGWAVVTGLMLIFCKEAGILFYAIIALVYFVGHFDRKRWVRHRPLVLPFAGFAGFVLWRKYNHQPYSPWAVFNLPRGLPWQTYLPNPFTQEVWLSGLGPFVLEFQWIFTGFILAGIVAGFFAPRPQGKPIGFARAWLAKFDPALLSFGTLLLGVFYVVSRTVPYVNQRYFLPLYPLVLLCFFAALVQLRIRPMVRAGLLAGTILLLFCCNFRTLDPVSKRITGTFQFGTHPMLSIATLRDPNDTNKDVLVYNLEHVELGYLLDDAFAQIKPTSQTIIVVDPDTWRIYERIDAKTFRRTTRHGPATIQLTHLKPYEFFALKDRPQNLYLLELPTFHNDRNEARLAPFYDVKRRLVFSRSGYALSLLEMTRKTPAPAS